MVNRECYRSFRSRQIVCFGRLSVLGMILCTGCDLLSAEGTSGSETVPSADSSKGELVSPPFDVLGDTEGLLLVWFDEFGVHTASRRSDVPESHRQWVRVDSLELSPSERLDPEYVYVADLREAQDHSTYPVRLYRREFFDRKVDQASGVSGKQKALTASSNASIVIYGAEWCGACRSAAHYFRGRGISFVEKNIERDSSASAELQRKARASGIPLGSIPVIDVRGTLVVGFDQNRIESILGPNGTPI